MLGELFLDLNTPREHLNYPSDLRKANYLAVGDVADVHLELVACNRLGMESLTAPFQIMAKVMLAKRKELDVFTITISSQSS